MKSIRMMILGTALCITTLFSGCGLEGPAAQQLMLGLTAVGTTAAVISAASDVAEAQEEASDRPTEEGF